MTISDEFDAALNRVCKWRSILAGWHLGTAGKEEPGVQAMRDLRELTLLLRVEVNVLTRLMIAKGVFTGTEWVKEMIDECALTEADLEGRFPGIRASDPRAGGGIEIFDVEEARRTMARLGFPE